MRISALFGAVASCFVFIAACDSDSSNTKDDVKLESINFLMSHVQKQQAAMEGHPEMEEAFAYRVALLSDWKQVVEMPASNAAALAKSGSYPASGPTARIPGMDAQSGMKVMRYYVSTFDRATGLFDYAYHDIDVGVGDFSIMLAWPTTPFNLVYKSAEGDTLQYVYGISSTYTPLLNRIKEHFGMDSAESMGKRDDPDCGWSGNTNDGYELDCDVTVTATRDYDPLGFRPPDCAGCNDPRDPWRDVQDSDGRSSGSGTGSGTPYLNPSDYVTVGCAADVDKYTSTPSGVEFKPSLYCSAQVKSTFVRRPGVSEWNFQTHVLKTTTSLSRSIRTDASATVALNPSATASTGFTVSYSENVTGQYLDGWTDSATLDLLEEGIWESGTHSIQCSPDQTQMALIGVARASARFSMEFPKDDPRYGIEQGKNMRSPGSVTKYSKQWIPCSR